MYIYAVVMWIMTGVLAFSDYDLIKKSLQLKKNTDLSKYKVYNYSKSQVIIFSIVLLISILTIFIVEIEFVFLLINVSVLVIGAIELITGLVVMKLYFNNKSIIYEGEIIKLKDIKAINKVKKLGKSNEILTYDGRSFMVNQAIADIVQSLLKEMKEEKVNRKKK